MRTSFILVIGWAFIVSVLVGIVVAYPGGDCAELANKSPEECAKYLARPRKSTENACVVYAILEIGHRHHAAAVGTLVQYLDYQTALPPKLSGFTLVEKYPAINALFVIGKPAVGPLIGAISKEDTSETVRENAVVTMLQLFRDNMPGAVSTLSGASRNAADNAASERLVPA